MVSLTIKCLPFLNLRSHATLSLVQGCHLHAPVTSPGQSRHSSLGWKHFGVSRWVHGPGETCSQQEAVGGVGGDEGVGAAVIVRIPANRRTQRPSAALLCC